MSASKSPTPAATCSVFLCFFCERSFTDKNVLQHHQETCDLRSLGLESLFAPPPPPRPKFDRAEKRNQLENLGLLPTWLVELQLSQRRTDVVCDVIVVDDSDNDDDDAGGSDELGDPAPVPPCSTSPVRYAHHRGGKRRRCAAKDDAAASAARNANKLLKIDICSPLGQRLRACIGSTAPTINAELQNVDGRSRCGRQPLSDNAGILNVDGGDVALLLRSRTVFFRDKFPVTYRPNRGNAPPHSSTYCHTYRFTKKERKKFCTMFDSGLNARSRRLMRSVKPCHVTVRRLPCDKLENGDSESSTLVQCTVKECGQVVRTKVNASAVPYNSATAVKLGAGDTEPSVRVAQTASVFEPAADLAKTMVEGTQLSPRSVADSKSSLSFYCDICKRVLDFVDASTLNIYRHYAVHGIADLELQETRLGTGETVLNLVEVVRVSDSEKEATTSPVNCDPTLHIAAGPCSLVLEAPSPLRGGILSNANGRSRPNASGRRVRWADEVEDPSTGSALRISEIIPHVDRECSDSEKYVTLDADDGDNDDDDLSMLETDPTLQQQQVPVVSDLENTDVIVVGDDSNIVFSAGADRQGRLAISDADCPTKDAAPRTYFVQASDPLPSVAAAAAPRASSHTATKDPYDTSPSLPTSEPKLPCVIQGLKDFVTAPPDSRFHGPFAFHGVRRPTTTTTLLVEDSQDVNAGFTQISFSRNHSITQSEIICVD